MNTKEFFEYVVEKVREIGIVSLFSLYGFSYQNTSKSYKYVDCPFHGGSMQDKDANIHERHNGFICYQCNVKPLSPIGYIMELRGLDFKSAVFDIAIKSGIVSSSDVDEYYEAFELKRPLPKETYKIKLPEELKRDTAEPNPVAPDHLLDKVYRIFRQGNSLLKGGSKLSKEHRKYLIDRKLSEEDIEDGKYFTLPALYIVNAIIQILKVKYNLGEEALEYIPGFYRDKNGKITFKYYDSIGMPIINARKVCKGIQIRLNKEIIYEKKNGKVGRLRYIWLSSDDIPEGCSCGAGPGTPVDVTYPKTDKSTWSKNLFITEGKFKAQQLSKFTNAIVISVQGVGNWRDVISEIRDIQLITNNLIEKLFICYDADIAYKSQVNMHASNMSNALQEEFPSMPLFYCLWNPDDGKGIDDLIFNEKTNTIKLVQKNVYSKLYSLIIKNVKEEGFNFDELSDEVKSKIFIECIYNRI